MQRLTMTISGMHCGGCVNAVRQALRAVPGLRVDAVAVGSARVTCDEAPMSLDAIAQAIPVAAGVFYKSFVWSLRRAKI